MLGVPLISLAAEPIDSLSGRDNSRDNAFDDFEEAADSQNNAGGQPETPSAMNSAVFEQEFPNRIGQKKSERAVRKPVVMIAREMKEIFGPMADRHLRVGVMRAYDVEDNERGQEKIRSVGKL